MSNESSSEAPTARNVKAWGNAPGNKKEITSAVGAKLRTSIFYSAPSELKLIKNFSWGVAPGFYSSRLWR
jgi:hypothetical protein